MALSVTRKYLIFRWTGADLTLSPGNAPWLSNVLKIVGYTVPGNTGLNNQSAYQGSFGGLTAGGTLQKLVQNQDYLLISGRYDGWSIASAVETVTLGATTPTLPALDAPAGGQASATSSSALSVAASSVVHASGYQLYTSATQAGAYAKLGGVLTSPTYSHTGLSAAQTQWYKWQALGDNVSYADSLLSAAFSGLTQNAPSSTLPTSPATGATTLLTFDVDRAFHDTNSSDAFATLLDGSTPVTNVAPNFGNWAHDTSRMHLPFRRERATRLDRIEYIDLYDKADASKGTYPISIVQKVVGKDPVVIATFTGGGYDQNKWVPVTCDSSGITEEIYFDIQGVKAVFPHRIRPFGAQLAYTVPQYDPVAEAISIEVFNNGNAYEYCENSAQGGTPVAYGNVDPAKVDINSHTGGLRDYNDWNDTVRLEAIDGTSNSQIAWRNNPDHAGYRKVDVIKAIQAKGFTYRYTLTNTFWELAKTFPGYVDDHPAVPAYTDANGNQVAAQPAKPWLNDMNTCVPSVYGRDLASPASYVEQADIAFQVALELGSGSLTEPSLSKFATFAAHPAYQTAPTPIRNAGVIKSLSPGNEQTLTYKWIWQYMRPQWEAARQSAVFDGHKGTLGAGKSARMADPTFGITSMPAHNALPRYQLGVQYFDRQLRGVKANGKTDGSVTEVEFHCYPTRAVAPHYGLALEKAEDLPAILHLRRIVFEDYGPDVKVVLGEIGYTDDSTAMELSDNTAGRSYVPPTGGYSSEQLVAAYLTRAIHTAPELGLSGIGLYSLRNKNGATAGTGAKWDDLQGIVGKLAEKHVAQALTRTQLGYQYAGTPVNPMPTDGTPRPDGKVVQYYTKAGLNPEYRLWCSQAAYAQATHVLTLPYGGKLREHNATGFTLTETELPAGDNTIPVDSFTRYVEVYSSLPAGGGTGSGSGGTGSGTGSGTGGTGTGSGTTQPTMTLTFPTAAQAQAATLTPTANKHNKKAMAGFDIDDDSGDAYSLHQFCQGLTYSDGTGGVLRYKINPAILGHDSQGNEVPTLPGKLSWDQMATMVNAGCDLANHSDLHDDTNAAQQVAAIQTLANTRLTQRGVSGPAAVLRAGVVPNNYDDYVTAFVNAGYPAGSITSASASGGLPQLPQYVSEYQPSDSTAYKAPTFSQFPANSGQFVLRRTNFDAGTATVDTAKATIDRVLAKGTSADPAFWRGFAHSDVSGIVRPVLQYMHDAGGNDLFMGSLRELAEFLETKAATVITKSVSGNSVTFTLDQSALNANVRWRDMTFLETSGATITGIAQTGAQGARYNGSLINFFNTPGQVPPLAT